MNPERWQHIKELFHSALERESGARPAFLAAACDGDSSLRAEVESLIAAHERPGSFLDAPAYEVAASMLADDQPELEAGRRIGHYQIIATLGAGGMGKVYLAEDSRLKRKVALKLLPASFVQDEERVRRFEQEARAASALNHPNILTIHEIGTEGDHARFIATEFVEGVTLRQHLRQAPLKLHEVLEIAIQTAAALSAAHAARIAHRDIKPENLMVRPDGYVKVLDFGLAKLTETPPHQRISDTDSLAIALVNTQPGMVMGTIVYMSPEQARGLDVDARTDIWSLGVVLYEMIAGHPPFRGSTNSDVMVSVLDREPPPLTRAAPGVSSELERIVMKALAKDREERYQTIKDMLIDLRRHKQRLEFEAEMSRSASSLETQDAQISGAHARQPSDARLQPPISSEQRKQVTVLFADLSGFTGISETLDAEEVNDHMNALWKLVDASILDRGGLIDKHMGDTVMALWGTRAAHEDDPERAIRAALAMQALVGEFVRLNLHERLDPERATGRPAIMRIGINTGPAFLSAVGSKGEWTATGAAVNVANRLQQAAPVGQILISHDTYRHVRGVFDVREMELVTVKGKAEPVHTYVVERAKPRAFRLRTRGVEGVETRMVGRKAELDRLMDAMQIVLEDRELRAITVVGDAGIGKSRLLYEFSNEVELLPERFRIFNGRATQAARGLPYSLVRDVFSFRFEIQDSDSVRTAREKLEQGMLAFTGTDEEARMRAHFIGHLIGFDFSASPHLSGILDDAKQIRDRAFHYAAQFFAAVARDAPVVLYLDDIHWADDGSLDFVDYLARTCAGVPLLILSFARPALLERRPLWGEGEAAHTRIQLQPLSKRESRHLVEEILRHAQSIPQVLRELVVSGAEGNPFYMEELIKMLIDQRVIVPGAEQWRVDASRLVEVRVPPTLTGVLQARLDGLSLWEKTVLQRASVVGREFWDRAVEQLGTSPAEARSDPAEGDVRAALESLRRKELIYRREASGFAGTSEYIFKHAILRDVTYESVLKRERRRYHHEVAEWLIERSGERVDEYAGTIAEHYERAREMLQAAGWYGRAGQQAREAYAPETAIGFYRKALEFMPSATEANTDEAARSAQRVEWHEGLGEVLWMQARFTEAVETYVKMRQLAEANGDRVAQARAWNGLASAQDRQGDYRAMLESARRAETLASGAGDASLQARKELARSLDRQGWALQRLGDAAAAMTLCEQALLISTELGKEARRERAHSLKSIGVAHTMLGHFEQAESYSEQALSLHRELGNRRGVGNMLNSLGETARLRGDYTAAVARYREALTITREIGDRANEMTYLSNLGGARIGLGDCVAAEADLRHVIRMAGTSRFYALSETYFFLAEALLGQGKTAEALEASQHALVLGQATANPEYIGGAWRTLGLVAAQFPAPIDIDHKPLDASACFAESLRVWTDTGMEAERARTLRACARYEQERGDRARAQAMMEEARGIFTRLGMKLELERMA
jgi:serine/threonine protein kinase/tetratricopeptide (TPR) repeat protein